MEDIKLCGAPGSPVARAIRKRIQEAKGGGRVSWCVLSGFQRCHQLALWPGRERAPESRAGRLSALFLKHPLLKPVQAPLLVSLPWGSSQESPGCAGRDPAHPFSNLFFHPAVFTPLLVPCQAFTALTMRLFLPTRALQWEHCLPHLVPEADLGGNTHNSSSA